MAEKYNYVLMIISILEISEDVWQVDNNRIKKKRENETKKKLNKFYNQHCHLKIAELIVAWKFDLRRLLSYFSFKQIMFRTFGTEETGQ